MMHITVTVDEQHLGALDVVAGSLRGAGMLVEQVLESMGIIIGHAPEQIRPVLEAVDGVVSVDTQDQYLIAPPENDIQ